MNTQPRLLWGIYALIAILVVGVAGYMLIEDWSFFDALYMTVITITTVGYAEVHPLSAGGRIFSIFLIVGGVGGALYAVTGIIEYIVQGHYRTTWGRRRMKARIAKLKGHFILCGYGRVGEEIAHTFKDEGIPFVVIDNRPDRIARAEQTGHLCLQADATIEEVLGEAGIGQARGLVAAVGSDIDNTYITLSARGLRSDLFIAARASRKENVAKLKRAGANRVVSPLGIGGRRMAMIALRPAVVDFIDTVMYGGGRELQLEDVGIGWNSPLVGLTLKVARSKTGIAILAMRRKAGKLTANPADEATIKAGDRLLVMGTRKRLASLEETFEGDKASK
jgi:voltage-gated potassium channel